MSINFPWLPKSVKTRSESVLEAEEKIRAIANTSSLDPRSKMEALSVIRRDFMHIRDQHADIASLDAHPGWIRLSEILQREIIGKLSNWRVMLRSNPEMLDSLESWCSAAEHIMGIQAGESKQWGRANELLNMDDVSLVTHVVGDDPDETNKGD